MAAKPTPVKIGPFNLGMNNRLPDTELAVRDRRGVVGTYLRSAVNVDISAPGTIKRRAGSALRIGGTDCHSLWASAKGDAYMVDGTELFWLTGGWDDLTKSSVRAGLTPGANLSFCDSPLGIVCTDGTRVDILSDGTYRPLSLPAVSPEPTAAPAAGFLQAGIYQLAFTFFDADGRHSGSTVPLQVELAAQGGILVSGLPAAFPTEVAGLALYMSEPNGDELFLAETFTDPAASLSISFSRTLTGRCPTLLHKPLPGGSIVRHHLGRYFVADGKFLYFSDPYTTTYDPSAGFIPFPEPVTVVESVGKGLWVVADKTYFISGDVAASELRDVLPYGGVAGTSGLFPEQERCFWMSPRGLVHADGEGTAENVTEKAVAMGAAERGASLYRESDGNKQVVTSLFGSEASGAAAHSFMEAEIVRKATVL